MVSPHGYPVLRVIRGGPTEEVARVASTPYPNRQSCTIRPLCTHVLVSRSVPVSNPCIDSDMFDTILIAVDLSATNDVVLDRATALGTSDQTEIILLHVIETLDGVSVEEDPEFYEELHENATKKMTPWTEQLQAAGFDVTARVDYGKQGQEIVAAARDTNADLVVMRSHVVDTNAESTDQVGTVSHQVALFAPCSVLLVREEG